MTFKFLNPDLSFKTFKTFKTLGGGWSRSRGRRRSRGRVCRRAVGCYWWLLVIVEGL